MKMKILKSTVLVAVMSVAMQASAGGTVALSPFIRGDGDDHGSDVYTAYNFDTEKTKHNVALELLWRVSKAKGQDDYQFAHSYLRSTITSPYKIDMGSGWDIGWSYRYYAPTDATSQTDGSYGSVGFRPWIVKDMGFLEFKARPSFYGYLQRHPSNRTTGTARFSSNLEVLPSFKITKNLSFLAYMVVGFKYMGGTKIWSNSFGITPELGYSFEDLGFEVSVFYDDSTPFGEAGDFDLFNSDRFEVGMNLTKSF